jgi:hypothetical protein
VCPIGHGPVSSLGLTGTQHRVEPLVQQFRKVIFALQAAEQFRHTEQGRYDGILGQETFARGCSTPSPRDQRRS